MMFKDFTQFNSFASKLFKDEMFTLIANAFISFRNMLSALRTEAYDYTTWYNKVMRDKYEDGQPVDITALPYLSVPRSQLAVMRGRIMKVREAVTYAANAITNIALGWKVGITQLVTSSVDSISSDVSLSATTSSPLMTALKRIQYSIGDIFLTFNDGDDTITVNGIQLSVSPLARGTIHIAKYSTGNSARIAMGQFSSKPNNQLRGVAGELIRNFLKTPLIVARSQADLAASSNAPVGICLVNRAFFNKRLIIWAETAIATETYYDADTFRIFECNLHARLVDANDVKSTIASSLYGYLSEDYIEAMNFNSPSDILVAAMHNNSDPSENTIVYVGSQMYTNQFALVLQPVSSAFAINVDCYGTFADVTEATTQTAINDLFYTENEWEELISSLSEA